MRTRFLSTLIMSTCLCLAASAPAFAADASASDKPAFDLAIKDHVFVPAQITIPADKTVKLVIKNFDATPAEFESDDFQAENVIPGHGMISLYVGPLKAGTYGFYDDFHEDDTKGTLVAQ